MLPHRPQIDDATARRVLLELADTELSFVAPEAGAKITDIAWPTVPGNHRVDQHLISKALQELTHRGDLVPTTTTTRGGAEVTVFETANDRLRRTAIDSASARKRLVYGRYRGWAQGTGGNEGGLIGPAAERIFHAALRDVAPQIGWQLPNPETGQIQTVLGVTLQGPLDNAAIAYLGEPAQRFVFIFEIKSQRRWAYHDQPEQWAQLLAKAAQLQRERPMDNVVPVLICRRAHTTLYRMVKDLGAFIFDTQKQWVLDREKVEERFVSATRNELGFDLFRIREPGGWFDQRMTGWLTRTLVPSAPRISARWQAIGHIFEAQYRELWYGHDSDGNVRGNTALAEIRAGTDAAGFYETKGW